MKTLSKKSK